MGKYKAVLFDLDGTLINTLEDLADATNYALNRLGFESRPVENFRYYAGNGIAVMIERALPENTATPQLIEQLKKHFFDYYGVHYADKTAAYKGMPELVGALRRKGLKVAVVTNKEENIAKTILNKLYPEGFDLIFGQRDNVPPKPDPTLALMAMKELGVEPEECIFVGDSGVDIETAVNSGTLPVGVLWGFRDERELRQNGAKHIISTPEELLNLL